MRSLHGAPGYNLQTAVETASHLIVAHDVNAESNDLRQLAPMAQAASDSLAQACTVIADAGYANAEHLAALDAQGITSYVAPNPGVNNQGDGTLYDKAQFDYDETHDCFRCPADKLLVRKQIMKRDKVVIYAAPPGDCAACSRKPACTQSRQRFVSRHFFEDALTNNARRLAANPEMMNIRRQTVEHPFGTIKCQILGNARLLMRGILGAKSELSLAVLAYNLKRACNMKGHAWMLRKRLIIEPAAMNLNQAAYLTGSC